MAHVVVALQIKRWHLGADRAPHTSSQTSANKRPHIGEGTGLGVARQLPPRQPAPFPDARLWAEPPWARNPTAPRALPYPRGRCFSGLWGRRRGGRCTAGTGGWGPRQCPRETRDCRAAAATDREGRLVQMQPLRGRGRGVATSGVRFPRTPETRARLWLRLATHSRSSRTRRSR